MPVTYRHDPDDPHCKHKIVEKATGKVVGCSTSARKAKMAVAARNAAHFAKHRKDRKR